LRRRRRYVTYTSIITFFVILFGTFFPIAAAIAAAIAVALSCRRLTIDPAYRL
jgi:CBS domain containing-hemolysin-like protein